MSLSGILSYKKTKRWRSPTKTLGDDGILAHSGMTKNSPKAGVKVFARILERVLISFYFFTEKGKMLLEMRYTKRGWQARVSEISKKLKIAQKQPQK